MYGPMPSPATGDIYYGNQSGFKTADSCFIATAAYGSLFHPYVTILRDFRDQYLLSNLPGRLFCQGLLPVFTTGG